MAKIPPYPLPSAPKPPDRAVNQALRERTRMTIPAAMRSSVYSKAMVSLKLVRTRTGYSLGVGINGGAVWEKQMPMGEAAKILNIANHRYHTNNFRSVPLGLHPELDMIYKESTPNIGKVPLPPKAD